MRAGRTLWSGRSCCSRRTRGCRSVPMRPRRRTVGGRGDGESPGGGGVCLRDAAREDEGGDAGHGRGREEASRGHDAPFGWRADAAASGARGNRGSTRRRARPRSAGSPGRCESGSRRCRTGPRPRARRGSKPPRRPRGVRPRRRRATPRGRARPRPTTAVRSPGRGCRGIPGRRRRAWTAIRAHPADEQRHHDGDVEHPCDHLQPRHRGHESDGGLEQDREGPEGAICADTSNAQPKGNPAHPVATTPVTGSIGAVAPNGPGRAPAS